jgi:hypothetical protein
VVKNIISLRMLRVPCGFAVKRYHLFVLASHHFPIDINPAKTHSIDISITPDFVPHPRLQRFDRSAVNLNLGMNADVSVFTHIFT